MQEGGGTSKTGLIQHRESYGPGSFCILQQACLCVSTCKCVCPEHMVTMLGPENKAQNIALSGCNSQPNTFALYLYLQCLLIILTSRVTCADGMPG